MADMFASLFKCSLCTGTYSIEPRIIKGEKYCKVCSKTPIEPLYDNDGREIIRIAYTFTDDMNRINRLINQRLEYNYRGVAGELNAYRLTPESKHRAPYFSHS